VTDPTISAQWGTWTDTGWDCANQPIAVCATPTTAIVWIFWVDLGSPFYLFGARSTDYGATFGAYEWVQNMTSGTITSIGAAMKADVPYVFFAHDPGGAGADDNLYRTYKNGSFVDATSWGKPAHYLFKGIAVVQERDFEILFCGQGPEYPTGTGYYPWKVWSIVYGDGVDVALDTWTDPKVVEEGSANLPYEYCYPSLRYLDVYRATFIGRYTGISPAVDRVHFLRTAQGSDYISSYWTEPQPSTYTAAYGMNLAYDSPSQYIYLISHNAAWRASVSGAASVSLYESDRVVRVKYDLPWYSETGGPVYECELDLDNHDGALSNAGVSGDPYEVIKPGSLVELSPGYVTTEGKKYRQLPAMWVEEVGQYVDRKHGQRLVRIRCLGWWGLLERWTARRAFQWADGSKNCFQILSFILARLGLDVSTGGESSSTLGNWYPAFLIKPGDQGRDAIVRFLEKIPDVLYSDLETIYAKYLNPSEASDYSYGGSGEHPILEGLYMTNAPRDNRSEAFGLNCYGEGADYSEVEQMGHRLLKVVDEAHETNAEALDRATAGLRKQVVATPVGWIKTRPNVGIELFDVITITDPSVGISSLVRRVTRIELEYDSRGVKPGRPRPVYEQMLHLGPR